MKEQWSTYLVVYPSLVGDLAVGDLVVDVGAYQVVPALEVHAAARVVVHEVVQEDHAGAQVLGVGLEEAETVTNEN